jgi:hypothetical protein
MTARTGQLGHVNHDSYDMTVGTVHLGQDKLDRKVETEWFGQVSLPSDRLPLKRQRGQDDQDSTSRKVQCSNV